MEIEQHNLGLPWPVIFDAVGFGLALVDAGGQVVLWNGWLSRHSGVSAELAIGRPLKDVFGVGLSPSFVSALNNALRYKLPVVLSNVLHRSPLPLYSHEPTQTGAERMPHAITMTPLLVPPWGACCLIQIADSSRAISREKVLQKRSDILNREVMTDSLTRAFSRGFFDKYYQQEFALARRQGARLSLIMVDVDYFKNYNDEYGHPAGDKTLMAVVKALQTSLYRCTDKLFRYGGEEFIVILPDCDQNKAQAIAEELRVGVLALQLLHRKSAVADQITISLGVTTLVQGQACSAEALLEAADLALYAAKNQGRNRVQYRAPQALQAD